MQGGRQGVHEAAEKVLARLKLWAEGHLATVG
jgi:hypothetical protein